MLVGLVNVIFNIVLFLVNVASWVLIAYVIMTYVMPDNKYTLLLGKYIEPLLAPLRTTLVKTFPRLQGSRFDFSPIALWLLLEILSWLLKLIWNLLV